MKYFDVGLSGVHALPMVAGSNEDGHYFRYSFIWLGQTRLGSGKAITKCTFNTPHRHHHTNFYDTSRQGIKLSFGMQPSIN